MHVEVGEAQAQVVVGGDDDDDFQLAHMPCANRDEVDLDEANGVTCAKDEGNIEEADEPHNGGDEDLEDLPYNDGNEDWLKDDDDHGALYEAGRKHANIIIDVIKQNYKLNMRLNLLKKKYSFLHAANLQIRFV